MNIKFCEAELETKICTKCGKGFPITKEYFPPDKRNKSGLGARCRKCACAASAVYFVTGKSRSPEKQLNYTKKYRQTIVGCLRNRFQNIQDRCTNPNHPSYKYYGGRGIKCLFTSQELVDYVVNELLIDPRGLDIDRIDNDGNYEKGNIQLIGHIENSRKKFKKNKKGD